MKINVKLPAHQLNAGARPFNRWNDFKTSVEFSDENSDKKKININIGTKQ